MGFRVIIIISMKTEMAILQFSLVIQDTNSNQRYSKMNQYHPSSLIPTIRQPLELQPDIAERVDRLVLLLPSYPPWRTIVLK